MASNGSQQPFFWTCKEAAEFLRVSLTTFYAIIKVPRRKGGPPIVRIAKNRMRFPRQEFIDWSQSRRN